jgi:hypothetical protein
LNETDQPEPTVPPTTEPPAEPIRVWAEERGGTQLLLTWAWSEEPATPRDQAADGRAVAATVGTIDGVSATEPAEDGVLVTYDPELTTKGQIARGVRAALSLDEDLKARASALLKRAPTYASLAKSLALDERVSPMPEVARSAAARRRTGPPVGMIPGFRLVSQVQMLIPVLRSLSSWSRTASPEVVQEHLTRVGLSRETLDGDLATANEALAFARAFAAEKASVAAAKASVFAGQARDWVRKQAADVQEQARKNSSQP